MKITARAPGKLVLLGEYAVLEGAPGLVMAANRHARVTLAEGAGPGLELAAPPFLDSPVKVRFADNRAVWPAAPLPLVDAVLATLADRIELAPALDGHQLTLDSAAFRHRGVKLGLGSSAALCVALLGALSAAVAALPAPALEDALAAHARFQQGRGSGIDVAASLFGGVLRFVRPPGGSATVAALRWPAGLFGCGVYSGAAASTPDRLARLARFRAAHGAAYRELMRKLGDRAETGIEAFAHAEVGAFLEATEAFSATLAELGRRARLTLMPAPHRELAAIGARCGVVYKTSGAGGGDFGLALSDSADRIERFAAEASAGGRLLLPLEPSPAGLTVTGGHEGQDLR